MLMQSALVTAAESHCNMYCYSEISAIKNIYASPYAVKKQHEEGLVTVKHMCSCCNSCILPRKRRKIGTENSGLAQATVTGMSRAMQERLTLTFYYCIFVHIALTKNVKISRVK